ncbi:MAG TPA: DNA topoisomerase IV subunit A [Thermoanaerobaculia bacterium]|nr:DNA topoisomerase IV subunit A [Thermoanaerobaculia bacterium]
MASARKKRPTRAKVERQARKLENDRVKTKRVPKKLPTLDKIEHLATHAVELAAKQIDPFVDVPTRALSNVAFSESKRILEMGDATQRRSLFNMNQARKFMQTFVVAKGCSQLLAEGKTTSIRDLYYMSKRTLGGSRENTFDDQVESDPIIEDLEVTLGALREELHLFAAKRGSAVGPLTLVDAGDTIDLSRMGSGGWSVPGIVESEVVQLEKHAAKFILLVEKEAVWARLNEDKFWKRHKCILVTGQGQPSRGVRRLLYRLVKELKLPLYVFVDNDPWGYYIHSVVKQGSINLAFESARMAIPDARFLGLSSYDPGRFGIAPEVSIRLNDQDRARAKEILAYDWFGDRKWQREIKHMLAEGVKWELEALSNKGLSFVTEEYLPKKIRDRDWI